jgi:hypothetical protein
MAEQLIPIAQSVADGPVWRRWLSTASVIAAATTFGLSYSLSAPLIAMSLRARGYPSGFIGLNAAMHALGVLMIAPFMPALAARFGARWLSIMAMAVTAIAFALFTRHRRTEDLPALRRRRHGLPGAVRLASFFKSMQQARCVNHDEGNVAYLLLHCGAVNNLLAL